MSKAKAFGHEFGLRPGSRSIPEQGLRALSEDLRGSVGFLLAHAVRCRDTERSRSSAGAAPHRPPRRGANGRAARAAPLTAVARHYRRGGPGLGRSGLGRREPARHRAAAVAFPAADVGAGGRDRDCDRGRPSGGRPSRLRWISPAGCTRRRLRPQRSRPGNRRTGSRSASRNAEAGISRGPGRALGAVRRRRASPAPQCAPYLAS